MLDASYQSGIAESPGARFVVKLKMPPLIAPTRKENNTSADNTTFTNSGVSKGDSSNSTAVPSEPTPQLLPEKLSVLFVYDDAILRKLFIRSIRNACPRWTVQGAASGEAALKLRLESNNHANDSDGDMQQDGDLVDEEQGIARPSNCPFDLLLVDQYMSTSSSSSSSSSSNNNNATQRSLLGTETVAAMRAAGIQSTICGLLANDMHNEFLAAGADCFTLKPLPCDKQALQVELLRITENLRQEER